MADTTRKVSHRTMLALVLLNALALAGVVASGAYFRHEFTVSRVELPQQTGIAIGWIPPAILMCNLLMAVSARHLLPPSYLKLCELAVLVIWGMVVWQHVIGIWQAYDVGPVILSQTSLTLSTYCV